MYDLDHMLNGKGSRQHHQNILRWMQHERFAQEVEAVQRSQKTEMRYPGFVRRPIAALLNVTMTIVGRRARRADVSKTLQVNSQRFAQNSKN